MRDAEPAAGPSAGGRGECTAWGPPAGTPMRSSRDRDSPFPARGRGVPVNKTWTVLLRTLGAIAESECLWQRGVSAPSTRAGRGTTTARCTARTFFFFFGGGWGLRSQASFLVLEGKIQNRLVFVEKMHNDKVSQGRLQ